MVYIGIDLGGTGIKVGVVDESGSILSQGETPTLAGRPYEDIIADMGRCMLRKRTWPPSAWAFPAWPTPSRAP